MYQHSPIASSKHLKNSGLLPWCGTKPERCDTCHRAFRSGDNFNDAKLTCGPWALICNSCLADYAYGLGYGKGQQYDWNTLERVR